MSRCEEREGKKEKTLVMDRKLQFLWNDAI